MLSMFLVLVIHANMVSLPHPSSIDLSNDSIEVIFRYFVESIGIVSVNLFVLISGWFKIKRIHICWLYQIVFLWGGMLLIFVLLGKTNITFSNLASTISLSRPEWFIKAYLVLCIISPILNIFVENSSEETLRNVLIWFYLFQSTYGILGANKFFLDGYSPLSFIGLYLLAQYARKVNTENTSDSFINKLFLLRKEYDILIFIFCVIVNTVIGIIGLKYDINIYSLIYAYNNPLNVIGALYLFLFFAKINIGHCSVINWLAASSFAVYLLHCNQMREYFTNIILYVYNNFSGVGCVLLIFIFLVLVYIGSVVIDQLRIISWNLICYLKKDVRL